MTLTMQLYDSDGGNLIGDWSGRCRALAFETNNHGPAALTAEVALSPAAAFDAYARRRVGQIVISDAAGVVYRGRLEDVAIIAGGIRIGAFGYWRALRDLTYTAVWSDSSTANWSAIDAADYTAALPARWSIDNNNRVYMAPNSGEPFGNAEAVGLVGYVAPDGGARPLARIAFDYVLAAPAGWKIELNTASAAWSLDAADWSLTGDGTTKTGSASVDLAVTTRDRVGFRLFYDNATPATFSGDTGDVYARITSIRLQSTTSSPLTAADIAAALLAYVRATNADQLVGDTSAIQSPGVDLDAAAWSDAWPADILAALAAIGDDTPQLYEAGVDNDRRLYFRPVGAAARAWYVDAAALALERSLEAVRNAAYAVYSGARTDTATDAASAARYGLTRSQAIAATTTSETTAEIWRDVALDAGADGAPRAAITLEPGAPLYSATGSAWPAYAARAGDLVIIRNAPADLGDLDAVRRFTLAATRYDAVADQLTLTPAELPTLDALVGLAL